ncbi:hypothetical protein [Nonomuraea cavernae]
MTVALGRPPDIKGAAGFRGTPPIERPPAERAGTEQVSAFNSLEI